MATNPSFFVILIACAIVAGILIWGVTIFGTGGDSKKANKVMQLRIAAQFVAVIIIVGFAWLTSRGGN